MSEVQLSIGGRDYAVACADGEEAHIASLGEVIDAKLQQLGGKVSARDAQNLLFAALLLADEIHEQRGAVSDVAATRERLESDAREARDAASTAQQALAERDGEPERLRGELDRARSQAEAAPTAAPGLFGDPDLAPALERFAEMLENCADKLESKAPAS